MARNLHANFITQLENDSVRPFFLYEGEFLSGTIRLWTGINNLSWDSKTWLGNGYILSLSGILESLNIAASGVTIQISGIPGISLSLVLQEFKQGGTGNFYFGFLDSDDQVISDPVLVFKGKLDKSIIGIDSVNSNIVLTYESILIDLDRPRGGRYTKESQSNYFSDDKGFDYVASLQDWAGQWGQQVRTKRKKKK